MATNLKEGEIVTGRYPPACHENCEIRQSLCVTNVFYSIQTLKMHFMTRLNVTFHSSLVLWYVFSQSQNSLNILCHPALPALPDFLAYKDASGAQDCAAVFGPNGCNGSGHQYG